MNKNSLSLREFYEDKPRTERDCLLDVSIHKGLAVRLRKEALSFIPDFNRPIHEPDIVRWAFVHGYKIYRTAGYFTKNGSIELNNYIKVEEYLFELYKVYPGQCHVTYKLIKSAKHNAIRQGELRTFY